MNKITASTPFIACLLLFATTLFGNNNPNYPKGFSPKTNTGIVFTENKGQVHDQDYKSRPDVLFSATTGQMSVYIKNSGVSYELSRVDSWKVADDKMTVTQLSEVKTRTHREIDQLTTYRIDLNWVNSKATQSITMDEALPGYCNYYLTSCPDGALNVKSYKGITLHDIYTGINLHYYGINGQLKHDYVVAPHANYKQIQVDVKGATISLNADGSLFLTTPLGKVQEGAPIVFQDGKQLPAKWLLRDHILSFEIANVNPEMELIIDPLTRLWGTYYGGPDFEYGMGCATDQNGNVFLYGTTQSTTNISSGGFQNLNNGGFEAFIVKFNAAGIRQWATYYGGTDFEGSRSCAVDINGSIYLCGATTSTNNISTSGAHQVSYGGGQADAMLIKFNASGQRIWATYFGGLLYDFAAECSTDNSGNVYICGGTASTNNIASPGAHQVSNGGGSDGFLAKFNSSGVRLWSTYYGDSGFEEPRACSNDLSGNVFLAGYTTSTAGIASGGFQNSPSISNSGFFVKFNSNGARQWGSFYNGTIFSIKNDPAGNIYICGVAGSTINVATPGSHQASYSGGVGADAMLVKFTTNCIRLWGTYYGGNDHDQGQYCVADNNSVFISGITSSTSGIALNGAQNQISGPYNAMLIKFDSNGLRQWGSYYGGGYEDAFLNNKCAIDNNRNVFLAGMSPSTLNIAYNGHQNIYSGNYDAYLVKFNDCNTPTVVGTINSTSVCSGQNIALTFTSSEALTSYNWSVSAVGVTGASAGNGTLISNTLIGSGAVFYTVIPTSGACAGAAGIYTITVNPLPAVSISGTNTICVSQSITLIANGASTYTWSTNSNSGAISVSPATNTVYTLRGTSSLGCISSNTAVLSLSVIANPILTVNSGSICAGKSFTISPNGANSYSYSSGSPVISPAINTTYTVTGSSIAGCTNTAVSSVTVNANPLLAVNSGTTCSGQSFIIIPSGANTYTYSSGSAIVTPTVNTSYSVTGTSSLGCVSSNTAISSVTVNTIPLLLVNSGSICSGSAFTITPIGAISYSYSSGTAIITPTISTTYTVTGTSLEGCSNTTLSSVTVNAKPIITVNSGSICAGQSYNLLPSGANTYTYLSGSAIVTPSVNTSYSVIGTSSLGCIGSNTAISSVTVIAKPILTVNSGLICAGKSFTLMPSGASTYSYSSATAIISPTINTTYTITGSNVAGCSNTVVSTVTVNAQPILTINSGSICSGNSFTMLPSGASTYTYSSGSNVVSPLINTSYSVTGSSASGCVGSNTAVSTVTVNASPTVSVNSGGICAGQSFTMVPSGAATYTYSSGSNVVTPSSSSTYSVYGKALNGCQATNPAISAVTVNALPNINIAGNKEICLGETTNIKATGASSYSWNTGATSASISVQPTATLIYTVTGMDQTNCTKSQTIEVTVSPCTTLNELNEKQVIRLYPNPNSGKFVLELSDHDQIKITIYNYLGQLIYEAAAEEQFQIDVSAYADGMYTLVIHQSEKEIQTIKFIKQ